MGIGNYRYFVIFLALLLTSVFYDATIVTYEIEGQLAHSYMYLATFNGVVHISCLVVNVMIFIITVPIIYKQIKGCKKLKSLSPKRPFDIKFIDVKRFETFDLDSTSDTASMLIRETFDSNSDISSKSSLTSQLFNK